MKTKRGFTPSVYKHRLGFTLLELLVTIAIVSIIGGIGFIAFSTVQQRGRDAKRKADLRSIAQAVEIFLQKNGHFPQTVGFSPGCVFDLYHGWCSDENLPTWIPDLNSNYIASLPIDPNLSTGHPTNPATFSYAYHSCDRNIVDDCGKDYFLIARLENSRDPELVTSFNYYQQNLVLPEPMFVVTSP